LSKKQGDYSEVRLRQLAALRNKSMNNDIKQLTDDVFDKKTFDEQTSNALCKIGFLNPASVFKNLIVLSCHADFKKLFPDFFPKLILELSESFDPDRGLNNFERFSEKIFDKNYFFTILNNEPWLMKALIVLFSGSQLLTDILLNDPSIFDWLKEHETLNKSKAKDILYRELWQLLQKARSYNEKLKVLRFFKKREYSRTGLRDLLAYADVVETIKDISNLADVCLQNSYEFCEEELIKKNGIPVYSDAKGNQRKVEFAVLGMGKLGGEELNFSSDIDIIYIYSSGEGKTIRVNANHNNFVCISNHEFFSKLARMVTDAINKITSDGNVFRIDLGLRPEGQSGDIASSIQSCEIYYESWGQTWERQALIKARISAGSEELGKEFEKIRRNFVYRKYLDFQAIDEIREGKLKIENKLKSLAKTMDVKLGKGGIREIEFSVQVFQLIYGGRNKFIHERNTLKALKLIYENKYIEEKEYHSLEKAYRFLRDLENKIQISFGLQTHVIPIKKEDQNVLAKKMGIKGTNKNNSAEMLLKKYGEHTERVHKIFDDLFKQEKDGERKLYKTALAGKMETPSLQLVEKYYFKNKQLVIKNLQLLEQGRDFSHPTARSQSVFEKLIPAILQIAARQSDPDEAINHLEKFIQSLKSREIFFDLLKEHTKLLELLLVLFGNSGYLSDVLIRQPDLLDSLLDIESIYRFKPKEKINAELEKYLEGTTKIGNIKEVLRKFKKGEELRIGLRFLLKEADLDNTFADLSLLAEVYLINSLRIARNKLTTDYGMPLIKDSDGKSHECGFAIIGMGKFGGCELDFGSDLDIVFVYEGEGQTEGTGSKRIQNQEYFTKQVTMIYDLAGSVTSAGYAYRIDTDLRPEGKQGVLTLPLSSYKKYFEERARLWERQSLTRARFIAGSEKVGKKFMELAHKIAYEKRFEYGGPAEMYRMRMKMEKELGKESRKKKDAKVGYGGLVDIEFIAQLLQVKSGGEFPALRQTRTADVLREAARIGLLSLEHSNKLKESYDFLRRVINGIRIVHERSESKLPEKYEKLSKLAFRMGHTSENEKKNREGFLDDYARHSRQVREIFKSFFTVKK
tara:strand:- start:5170 stop:8424 length:3255 start_codon:yes stop_codon:yes gene_type:complete